MDRLRRITGRLRYLSRRERVLALFAAICVLALFWPRVRAEYYYLRIVTGRGEQQVTFSLRLQGLGNQAAVPPLLRLLRSDDSFLRDTAARSLARYAGEGVVSVLIQVAESDPDVEVRIASVWSLGELHDPRAMPVLRRIAASDRSVRGNAIDALWKLGPEGRAAAQALLLSEQ